jgi:glycosyltransferase involved in cell wall biosynthesis
MLSPEPPYPLHGGGAFRIASLVHYFAQFADVDLILFSDSGKPANVPDGLLRSQTVIPLPVHSKGAAARYLRNAKRALRGVPPLIDRLRGHEHKLEAALAGKHYDMGIVEHFWCAPYRDQIARVCDNTVLDLHNVESVLHERCAETSDGLVAAGQSRFARCSREMEAQLLPEFSTVLATSDADAATARRIAPASKIYIYPNALPERPVPQVQEEPVVVFSGNFEYHPNIDAVRFLAGSIWPEVRKRCPDLRLRLVGRGDQFIRHLLPSGFDIELTGPLQDAFSAIAAARIVIAPLRSGSGTRIKILEAWAAKRPVIATLLAAEGLDCQKDRDLIVANEGSEFGSAIALLNSEADRRAAIAANGRRLFEEQYTWQVAWRMLDKIPFLRSTSTGHRYTEDSDANRR